MNQKSTVNKKKSRNQKICAIICIIMIVAMIIPLFLTGCGNQTPTAVKHNNGPVCEGVTILDNEVSKDSFEYNGYNVNTTELEWFFSSDYLSDINAVVTGNFVESFEYLGTQYIVFYDSKTGKTQAVIVYDGADDSKNIAVSDEFVYEIRTKNESDTTAPTIDYTENMVYSYANTDITKVN